MKPSKKIKVIYWVTTIIIFLFEGVIPALTSQSEMAKEGIRHLGYPAYFGVVLTVFKVIGAILLILPNVPARVKEWTYAGFAFDFIFAAISNAAVNGFKPGLLLPVAFLGLLIASYISRQKIYNQEVASKNVTPFIE